VLGRDKYPYHSSGSGYLCTSAIHEMRSSGLVRQGFRLGMEFDCEGYCEHIMH
jgi:hypothetical protein